MSCMKTHECCIYIDKYTFYKCGCTVNYGSYGKGPNVIIRGVTRLKGAGAGLLWVVVRFQRVVVRFHSPFSLLTVKSTRVPGRMHQNLGYIYILFLLVFFSVLIDLRL